MSAQLQIAERPLSEIVVGLMSGSQLFTDIHIESGMPVMLRQSPNNWIEARIDSQPCIIHHEQIIGFLNGIFVGDEKLKPESTEAQRESQRWKRELHEKGSLHPSVTLSHSTGDNQLSSYRVRCTIQKQMMGEALGLVLRPVKDPPKSLASIGLPFQVEKMLKSAVRGMIVVTGPTGSGKSTTLAAMISEINQQRSGNIITIEDPVEFIHARNKCIINSRELGVDVNTFAEGVRDDLRFVPDVILIGEIRDSETMRSALRAAESGHMVLTSMHAATSISAIRKMLAYLADSQADMQSMVFNLVGVIAQALLLDKNGSGQNHLASEVLDCREARVINALVDSASGDECRQKLNVLEKEISQGR